MELIIMEKMSKEEKIQSWEKHYYDALDKKFYAIKRIDLLTISISGATIYIVFEILRFFKSNIVYLNTDTFLLKISAISAVFAIAVNLASQFTGYKANDYEAIFSRKVIDQISEDINNNDDLKESDQKSKSYSKLTSLLNSTAVIFMTIGIILLVIFNLITF